MKIRITQEIELSEEQENWYIEDIIDFARDLVNDGELTSDTVDIKVIK